MSQHSQGACVSLLQYGTQQGGALAIVKLYSISVCMPHLAVTPMVPPMDGLFSAMHEYSCDGCRSYHALFRLAISHHHSRMVCEGLNQRH